MRYLAKHFCCLRLEEAVDLLRRGRPLPRYAAVVTFDDGFRNNLLYAYPVLRRIGVPATIFLTTGHIGRGTQLLWTERVGRLLRAAKLPQCLTVAADPAPLTLSFQTAAERDEAARRVVKRLKSMPSRSARARVGDWRISWPAKSRATHKAGEPNADRYTFLTWSEAQELARGGMTIGSHTVEHPIMSSLDDDRRSARWSTPSGKSSGIWARRARCSAIRTGRQTISTIATRPTCRRRVMSPLSRRSRAPTTSAPTCIALRRLNIGRGHRRAVVRRPGLGILALDAISCGTANHGGSRSGSRAR